MCAGGRHDHHFKSDCNVCVCHKPGDVVCARVVGGSRYRSGRSKHWSFCPSRSQCARLQRSRNDEELGAKVRASFLASDRTYGARRVWRDLLADGLSCGLHRIERLMQLQALKARPRRRRLPPDLGERQAGAVAPNVLDRTFEAAAPNRKWIADFTYVWTAEGWLYVAAVIDLFSRRVVGWSMSAAMTAQLVTDALVTAIWRRGKPMRCCITPIAAASTPASSSSG